MKPSYPLYIQAYVDIKNKNLNKPFTYGVPESVVPFIYIGGVVRVPFGKREILAYVIDVSEFPPALPGKITIRPVIEALEAGSLWDKEMLMLARWMEKYYGSSFVASLKSLIPGAVRLDKDGRLPNSRRIKKVLLIKDPVKDLDIISKKAPTQGMILRFLTTRKGAVSVSAITKAVKGSYASISALEKKGYVKIFTDEAPHDYFKSFQCRECSPLPLTEDQQTVFNALERLYNSDKAEVALLHGITGSGKTEIYLQMIEKTLRDGREALVLVPEISLTPQAIERFRGRFSDEVAVLHSGMTEAERRRMWWKIRNREVRVVLGARSAVFAPLENIGIIVVDEEHEHSYKQDHDPRYHARQVAIKRAMSHKALVILGSATPAFETYFRAKEGKYHYLELPRRIGQSVLPEIKIVNLKKDLGKRKDSIIGDTLRLELENVIKNDAQAILFLNRRGFSAFLLCSECANVIKCPFCDITLTFHKDDFSLKCHYCGYRRPAPNLCPVCNGNKLRPVSFGIQKVEEELKKLFPDVSCIRMDRDTTSGRDAHYKILKKFAGLKRAVLLGTQMVAKGLDFPGVTLVGVVMADVSLHLPDFRSVEHTYQLLVCLLYTSPSPRDS